MNTACGFVVCLLVGFANVHDGDTMRVDGYSVRLQGVDAEELSEPHGDAARAALQQIVRGVRVSCQVVGHSYNRAVAYCITETGVDVNAEIIRRGFALDCGHYSHGKFRRLEPAGVRTRLIQKPYC